MIEAKTWESSLSQSRGLKSKVQALPEDVQAALGLESVEILRTLKPQEAANLGEALPPLDVRKEEISQMIQKFQEWMETAVASFAKQGARSMLAVINDSDGTNEKSEGLARLPESYELDNLVVPDVFMHVQLVRVVRNLGNEDPDIVVNCLDLEATCRLLAQRLGSLIKTSPDTFKDHALLERW